MPLCGCGCGTETRGAERAHGHFSKRVPNPDNYVVELRTGCWLWQGGTNRAGYGRVRVNKVLWLAHRFHWVQRHGEIPKGLHLHHRCETRACVNADHMELIERDEHTRLHWRLKAA